MKAGEHPLATERVRQRLKEWKATHGRGAQRALAKAVGAYFGETRGDQWMSGIIKGRTNPTLNDLDAFADALGVPPGELVCLPGRIYLELTFTELEILNVFRKLPFTAQQHIVSALRQTLSNTRRISIFAKKGVAEFESSIVKNRAGDIDGEARPATSAASAASAASPASGEDTAGPEISSLLSHTLNALVQLQSALESSHLPDTTPSPRTGTARRAPDSRRIAAETSGRRSRAKL